MKEPDFLPTQQIGKLGELLVQYQLLRFGIESAQLTTDSGIDLVAYSPNKKEALTIQIKANLKPKKGGGKGNYALDWYVSDNSPADLFAFVDVSERLVWLVKKTEIADVSQQHSKNGKYHFYITTEDVSKYKGRKGKDAHISNFVTKILENRIKEIFG